jgi:hypothetical protein
MKKDNVNQTKQVSREIGAPQVSARLTLAKLGIPRTTFYRW